MSYTHLTRDQRVELGALWRAGHTKAEIARHIGKHRATIGRELTRNAHTNKTGYHVTHAHKQARQRRAWANDRPKITVGSFLERYIPRALACEYSPEQIAGKLKFVLGEATICHETIYRWIYLVRPNLRSLLRCTKGKYRRKRGTNARWKKRELAKKTWIDDRPEAVNTRSRIGDWEGDTVHGAAKSGYIATLVERASGYLVASKLENSNGEEMLEAVTALQAVPAEKRLTLTLDNGFEMSEHEEMQRRVGLEVYFAHAYHSWERGTNENTNGLLRQYFPKKTSFEAVTQEQVDWAVRRLNTRPRKRLGYQSPYTVFHSGVALGVRS
ncbi:MAG TPA: IS30 family transposase [Candidatus Saccharimonadia bacterium]|nr:IS30 family transposase [Candidatus Saccharimonadia bacterium]